MTPLTYESYRRNPELTRLLIERAHRQRAEEIDRLVVAPVKALFKRLFARPVAKIRRSVASPACG